MLRLRPPSLQEPYTEFWSGDPALHQPTTKAEHKAHKSKLKRARETGNWKELLIAGGEQPTGFILKPLEGDQLRKLTGLRIGGLEMIQLAFRAALVDIENLGELKVSHEQHPELGQVAAVDVTNALDRISLDIVNELGALVLERAQEGLPKS